MFLYSPILFRVMNHLAVSSSPIIERCWMRLRKAFQCHTETFNCPDWLKVDKKKKSKLNNESSGRRREKRWIVIQTEKYNSIENPDNVGILWTTDEYEENLPNWWGIHNIGGTDKPSIQCKSREGVNYENAKERKWEIWLKNYALIRDKTCARAHAKKNSRVSLPTNTTRQITTTLKLIRFCCNSKVHFEFHVLFLDINRCRCWMHGKCHF